MDQKEGPAKCPEGEQFYKTGHEIGLNPGDGGGPQAHFFERFLTTNSNINEDKLHIIRQGYLFTSRLHQTSNKGKKGNNNNKKKRPHNLLTARHRRALGIFEVATGDVKYNTFRQVHHLWKGYFREVIGVDPSRNVQALQTSLIKADYTGCHFVIAASKCPSFVGAKGFVVQETKNCFRLVTETDRVICVPKYGSLFAFTFDNMLFKLYGSHFRKHGFERAKMKIKITENIDL